jgi:hypothetical protein
MNENPYQSSIDPCSRLPDPIAEQHWLWVKDKLLLILFGVSIFCGVCTSITVALLAYLWLCQISPVLPIWAGS